MENHPCLNPNCSSHGKPHPNCRCYMNMAEGGEVNFCSANRMHRPECEYFTLNNNPEDHGHSVAGFLAKYGTGGLINLHKINDMEKYQSLLDGGHKHLHKHAESLFSGEKIPHEDNLKSRKAIEDWIERGGADDDIQNEIYEQHTPQNFAEGGEVKIKKNLHNQELASAFPEHNMVLQNAKGRISQYLNNQKPQKDLPKLAFDSEPDQRTQEKSYKKALDIANHPLSILKHVSNGTIEPEHVAHFNAMHPEVNDALQKKLTEKITESQLKGKKPNYKIRQSLSLLMGTNLSGELTPQNMQAIQATFQLQSGKQAQPQAPVTKNKKNTSSLSKSSQSFLTGSQSLASRQQKQ